MFTTESGRLHNLRARRIRNDLIENADTDTSFGQMLYRRCHNAGFDETLVRYEGDVLPEEGRVFCDVGRAASGKDNLGRGVEVEGCNWHHGTT